IIPRMSGTTRPTPAAHEATLSQPEPASENFFQKFTVLLEAPRELWLVFAIKLLAYAAYAVTNSTLKLWLSSDFGYSDSEALHTVMAWSISMTVFTLLRSEERRVGKECRYRWGADGRM